MANLPTPISFLTVSLCLAACDDAPIKPVGADIYAVTVKHGSLTGRWPQAKVDAMSRGTGILQHSSSAATLRRDSGFT